MGKSKRVPNHGRAFSTARFSPGASGKPYHGTLPGGKCFREKGRIPGIARVLWLLAFLVVAQWEIPSCRAASRTPQSSLYPLSKIPLTKGRLASLPASRGPVHMGIGEAEIQPVRLILDSPPEEEVQATLEPAGWEHALEVSLWKAEWVPGSEGNRGRVPDILVPVEFASPMVFSETDNLLFLKIKSLPNSAGFYELMLTLSGETTSLKSKVLVHVHNVPISLPNLLIQGCLKEDKSFDLIEFLRDYGFTGICGVSTEWHVRRRPEGFKKLCDRILSLGYKAIRIPNKTMYGHRRAFPYPDSADGYKQWLRDEVDYLNNLDDLLQDKKYRDVFSFRCWDEPQADQYNQVYNTSRLIKENQPNLRLELTEPPDSGLSPYVDTWSLNIRYLDRPTVLEAKTGGKKCILYANSLHGVNRKSYTYDMRAIGYLLWKFRLDGYYFWGLNDWEGDVQEMSTTGAPREYKRGILLYRLKDSGKIVPSLRLELFRDGLEDLSLLKYIAGKGEFKGLRKEIHRKLKTFQMVDKQAVVPDMTKYHHRILSLIP
ncbi:MAG TPA: DUF4091 domain-containing protein [Syntrophobacteraceae bacterium]|nr:DUF4091 domain-containing protein [Syntrophobacteraceae bacterium]